MTNFKESKQKVEAIVLAAGQGKRMLSAKPKVLHEILGQTILGRILQTIDQLALGKIHIVVGVGAEAVMEHVKELALMTPVLFHQQKEQLGTGHAFKQVESQLAGFEGDLLVLPGDTPLITPDLLRGLLERHRQKQAKLSLLTTLATEPRNCGRVLRSTDGKVIGIIEARDASPEQLLLREINTAIYAFAWPAVQAGLAMLTNDNQQKEYYLTDLIAWAAKQSDELGNVVVDDWQSVSGINGRWELAEATKYLSLRTARALTENKGVFVVDPQATWIAPEVKCGRDSVIYPGCFLVGAITIGENCHIGPGTSMEGNIEIGSNTKVIHSHLTDCRVGKACSIGPYAHVRPGTNLADGVKIGNFVEVKNSSVGSQTNISHLSYVGDTKIGQEANLGAGTITANYDHITKEKFSTAIGDGTSIGSNTVLIAPLAIGDDACVAAGTVVTKDVPAGSLAVGRTRQENTAGWTEKRRKKHQTQQS